MYFDDRNAAGKALLSHLEDIEGKCVIVCATDGAVLVAEPIASQLKAPIFLLLMKDIRVPGGSNIVFGNVDQSGGFTYSNDISTGLRQEFETEFHGSFEEQKIHRMHEINQMISKQGDLDPKLLNDKNILIVSDGMPNGSMVDSILAYLKPIRTKKIIAVTPFASVPAIDRLHIQVDRIVCLDVKQNYLATEHYYNQNSIPTREELQHRIEFFKQYFEQPN